MKTSRKIRLGVFVLALTVIVLTIVSWLIARIASSGTENDSRLVAEWGVEIYAADHSLFHTYYQNGKGEVVVRSSTEHEVVAPGSSDSGGLEFSVKGRPEVASKVTFDVIVETDIFLKYDGRVYLPIIFSLKTLNDDGETVVLFTGRLTELAEFLNEYSETTRRGPGEDISETFWLTWEWPFESGHDVQDTILGDLAAGKRYYALKEGIDYNLTLDFKISIVVEQIGWAKGE